MSELANPFQNEELLAPVAYYEELARFTRRFRDDRQEAADPDNAPFERYVDLWWAAFCIGVRRGDRTTRGERKRFIDGNILSRDPWRITLVKLIAVAVEGTDVVAYPKKMIAVANDYAATGLPVLLEVLKDASQQPIWSISNYISDICKASGQ